MHHDDGTESNAQSTVEVVANALNTLERRNIERRQREVRTLIAEADRRGDETMVTQLMSERLTLDRRHREL
jgi:DNA primase